MYLKICILFIDTMSTLSLTFNNSAGGLSIALPITGSNPRATINWGEGDGDVTGVSTFTHTFKNTGDSGYTATPTVVFQLTSGSVTRFGSGPGGWTGSNKLTNVATSDTTTWGLGSSIKNFKGAFVGTTELISLPTDVPSTVTDMTWMFYQSRIIIIAT